MTKEETKFKGAKFQEDDIVQVVKTGFEGKIIDVAIHGEDEKAVKKYAVQGKNQNYSTWHAESDLALKDDLIAEEKRNNDSSSLTNKVSKLTKQLQDGFNAYEALKKENEKLKDTLSDYDKLVDENRELKKEIGKVKEENEKLLKAIDGLNSTVAEREKEIAELKKD